MWLIQYSQVNSWKLAYLTALVILWNTSANSSNCGTLLSQISSICERYQAYFVHKISQEPEPDPDFADTALKELMQIINSNRMIQIYDKE